MPKLLKTSTNKIDNRKAHYHIAYVKEDGSGVTAEAKDHQHQIFFQQATQAITDPVTGQMLRQASSGGIMLSPGEDGHTHNLTMEPIGSEKSDKKEKDEDIVTAVKMLWKQAKEIEKNAFKDAEEAEGFYTGKKQWKENQKKELENKQRAALTINEIEPKIDLLSGYQRQNRFDIKYLPTEGGDSKIGDILTALVKNLSEQCSFDHEETKIFEDETIVGRGNICVEIDYDKNIRGDIVISHTPWKNIRYGPHEKEDCSDLEYLTKEKWLSKGKISEIWPDKASEIQKDVDRMEDVADKKTQYPGQQYPKGEGTVEGATIDPDFVDIIKKEYRVIECYRRKYDHVKVIVNQMDDFYDRADDWKDSDIKAVKDLDGFKVIPRLKMKIRKSVIAGETLLEDDISELFEDFNIIPVYAKKRGNYFYGKIQAVKDTQREINKRHSQITDIINKVNAYGYFIDGETFETPKDEEDFKNNSSSAGFVAKVRDVNRIPKPTEGVKFPAEVANLLQLNSQKLREIMNINPEMLGINSRAESGVAIAEKKRQGLVGNEFLFDNLALGKRRLGRLLIGLIQKLYTPERMVRILENNHQEATLKIGGQPITKYTREELIGLLKDADLSKYDVVVSESAYSPTQRQANFTVWAEMAGKGFPIPPQVLIELSDLPDKEKVIEQIQQQQQQSQDMEKAKMQTEITKSQIAAQSRAMSDMGQ